MDRASDAIGGSQADAPVFAAGADDAGRRQGLRRLLGAGRGSVRWKLLALVLLPVLLALPITLALAMYWGGKFGYDQLFIKVSTDLSVAEDVFERAQRDYLDELARLAESFVFRVDFARDDLRALERETDKLRERQGFGFLHLTDRRGRIASGAAAGRQSRPSPLLQAALLGDPAVGIEIYSAADLAREDPTLARQLRLELLPTERAAPSARRVETRAMVIRAVYPVRDANGNVRAVLDGGLILNGNFGFVDSIRDLVYGPGSLPEGSLGTVTVFLDDVRISTNVPLAPGERALGTRVSQEVRDQVLSRGERWVDRAFVVNDWYISGYVPIVDVAGARVGMLYAGFLEAPFRADLTRAMAALVGIFAGVALISVLLGVLGAKGIFEPLETMSAVIGATRAGRHRRVGPIASRDEIGMLARELDGMLDLLAEQNRQIRDAADSLERKVEARTAELSRRNAELERTIALLRETRRALVASEKLAALGELSAGMAHEINNPMAVILGNLDVLRAELGDAAAPVREEIELIVAQVYRVKDIIDSLLQYARPADLVGLLETLDVNAVVQETLKLVGHLLRRSEIDVSLDLGASRPIRMAPQDLQQVLVNLLVNAIHALDGTLADQRRGELGRVRITTRDWDGTGVCIQVSDNGPGIPSAVLDEVFTPFFTTKPVGSGSGLGLYVSHMLIHRYGGHMTARSAPGAGADLTLWLLAEPRFDEDDALLAARLKQTMDETTARATSESAAS